MFLYIYFITPCLGNGSKSTIAAFDGLADFDNILNRIGFNQPQHDAIIDTSVCRSAAMIGLLSTDQVLKFCKWIENCTMDPIVIMTCKSIYCMVSITGSPINNSYKCQFTPMNSHWQQY